MDKSNKPYSNYISRVFPGFIEFCLWFSIIVIPIAVGILFGLHEGSGFSWGFFSFGLVLGFIGTFIFNILAYGTLTLFMNMNENNKKIEERLANIERQLVPTEEKAIIVPVEKTNHAILTEDKIITPEKKYDFVGFYKDGLAMVKLNDKYGFIDETGKEIIPVKYDTVYNFSNETSMVKLNGEWFYINKKGERIQENK